MRLFIPLCITIVANAFAPSLRADDDPKTAEDYADKATEYYAKREFEQAIKLLNEAIRLDPTLAIAFSRRGAVWFAKKDYDRAIKDVDEAIRLAPDRPSSGYYIRGAAWYMKKEYSKAVKDLDHAIRINPKDFDALNSRAWAAATCPEAKYRDAAKSLEYAKRACDLDGWMNAFYLGTAAAAYAANGDFENAVKWQRKALEDDLYLKECGEEGRTMLRLFEQRMPYLEPADGKK